MQYHRKWLILLAVAVSSGIGGWHAYTQSKTFPGTIAFRTVIDGKGVLFIAFGDARQLHQITAFPSWGFFPMLSPDGSTIAYISDPPSTQRQICVMPRDGGQPTMLGAATEGADSLSWSPDGTSLVFSSGQTGTSELYRIRSDGTMPQQLTFNSQGSFEPAWSPDGRYIIFSDRGVLYRIDADGSNRRQLSGYDKTSGASTWRPDSQRFAYSADNDIYTRDMNGNQITPLVVTSTDERHPVWSPDGQYIAFVRSFDDESRLWIMRADGTEQRELLIMENDITSLSWVP